MVVFPTPVSGILKVCREEWKVMSTLEDGPPSVLWSRRVLKVEQGFPGAAPMVALTQRDPTCGTEADPSSGAHVTK